jgi:TonB family protein
MVRALLQRKLEEFVVLTRESTSSDGVAVALREDGKFVCRASQGFAPEPGVVVEPGQGVCGRCIIDARVLVCQDLSGDVKSALAAPVIVGDEIEGLIAAFSFRSAAFDPSHIDLVSRIAVDIGNQIASPEAIHLVPRDPVSILNDPRADVVAVDDLAQSSREKHLEVLDAVMAPNLPSSSEPLIGSESGFSTEPALTTDNIDLPASSFHFLGYDDAPQQPETEPLPPKDLLGEYLSKWDIAVIFGAILIAMVAFSLWIHHRRAQAVQPYTASYIPDSSGDSQSASAAVDPSHSTPGRTPSKSGRSKVQSSTKHSGQESIRPSQLSDGTGKYQDTGKSPLLQASTRAVNSGPITSSPILDTPSVAGTTAQAELVHKVEPIYPSNVRPGAGAVVTLDLKVGADGRVGMIKVLGGTNPFVSSALNAVRQWRYEPATQNGKKVESSVRVDINFTPDSR